MPYFNTATLLPVLLKNVKILPKAVPSLAASLQAGFQIDKVIKERRKTVLPIKQLSRSMLTTQFQIEEKEYSVDEELPSVLSRADYQKWLTFRKDLRNLMPLATPLIFGGLGFLYLPFWMGRDWRMPSSFLQSWEERQAAGLLEDMERIKFSPHFRIMLKYHVSGQWHDDVIVRKENHQEFNELIHMQKCSLRLSLFDAWAEPIRKVSHISHWGRDDVKLACKVLGLPWRLQRKYDMFQYICEYFETTWADDVYLRQSGLDNLSDQEIFLACHARRIARWEETEDGLNRAELVERLNFWLQICDKRYDNGARAPVSLIMMWQANTFCDEAFDSHPEVAEEKRILADNAAAPYYYTDLRKAYTVMLENERAKSDREEQDAYELLAQKEFDKEMQTQQCIADILHKLDEAKKPVVEVEAAKVKDEATETEKDPLASITSDDKSFFDKLQTSWKEYESEILSEQNKIKAEAELFKSKAASLEAANKKKIENLTGGGRK